MSNKSDKGRERVEESDPPGEGRREYLKTVGGLAAGLAIGAAAGWLSKPAETTATATERITQTVAGPTVTKTITATQTTPTPGKVTLKLWTPDMGEFLRSCEDETIQAFVDDNPNIDVEITRWGWSPFREKLTTVFTVGGEGPDIYLEGDDQTTLWRNMGANEPLDRFIEQWGQLEDFDKTLIGNCTQPDGKIYAMPLLGLTQIYFWNRRLFREAGLPDDHFPATWDELDEVLPQLAHDDVYATSMVCDWRGGFYHFNAYFWALGGEYFEGRPYGPPDDLACTLNSPEGVGAIEEIVKRMQYSPGGLVATAGNRSGDDWGYFSAEKIAYVVSSCNYYATLIEHAVDPERLKREIAFATYPRKIYASSTPNANCYMISPKSEHKDEAWKLMTYFLEPERIAKACGGGYFPCRKAAQTPELMADPVVKTIVEQYKNAGEYPGGSPAWPGNIGAYTLGGQAIASVFIGERTPKEAVDWLAEEVAKSIRTD